MATEKQQNEPPPFHPFWCDDCGGKAAFTIRGCPVVHDEDCPRFGENPDEVYERARAWCLKTGGVIP